MYFLSECTSPAVKIPDANETLPYEEYTFSTDSMLVILNTSVDYEVNQFYTLIFQIIDDIKSPPLTGQATLKVGITLCQCVSHKIRKYENIRSVQTVLLLYFCLQVRVRDINDNCPILAQRDFYHFSDPALQTDSLVQLEATDEDDTINKELYYVRGSIAEE